MSTLTRSGYLVTPISVVWTSGQDLNTLTDNEYTDAADEVNNSSTLYMYADVEIVLASAAFSGVDSGFDIFLIPSVDGTNFATWTGNGTTEEQENSILHVGFVPTTGATAAQRLVYRNIELPSGKFKWAFRNRGNVTTAGSGNSATWRPHSVAF